MNDATLNREARMERDARPRAQEPPILFLHGIDRHYRQGDVVLEILRGAELAIWPGQSVALVAPSGSGKSTLLHIAGLLETPDDGEVYFVHSYYCVPADAAVVAATTDHGGPFCSALWRENVYATQFHPEKSGAAGMRILDNFARR